jgi:hypothetical protein
MSHVATIEIELKDLEALRAACVELGLVFNENKSTYRCWGTGKDLYRLESYQRSSGKRLMPEGWELEEMGQCEHAISVKGAHVSEYEIGVARRRDGKPGYQLLCDLSGADELKRLAGDNLEKFRQAYAVEVAVRAAKRAGFRVVKKTVRTDGSVAIVTQR